MIEDTFDDEEPSKSQRKRDMRALKDLAQRLSELSVEQLEAVRDNGIREALLAAKKITRGNARKRQLQYAARLMSKTDDAPIRAIVDKLDAGSAMHIQKFHQLEIWRELLIKGDPDVMGDILSRYPDTDRQHFRQLVRQAQQEATTKTTADNPGQKIHFRKLFQFLKSVTENQ